MELPVSTHFLRIARNLEATLQSIQEMKKAHPVLTPDGDIHALEVMLKHCQKKAEEFKGDTREFKQT